MLPLISWIYAPALVKSKANTLFGKDNDVIACSVRDVAESEMEAKNSFFSDLCIGQITAGISMPHTAYQTNQSSRFEHTHMQKRGKTFLLLAHPHRALN